MILSLRRLSCLIACLGLSACVTVTTRTSYPQDSLPTRPWPEAAHCPTPTGAARDATTLQGLINTARAGAGLPPLRLDPALTSVSQAYACENAARQSLDHVGSDGSDVLERFRRGGILPAVAAENTGLGYDGVEAAFRGWMASPHHRANILRPGLTAMGLGEAAGARPTWVLDLMAPR
jgi:uncharacterized protein YkwD